ncbi:ferredoxin family protein [Chlorobium sp. BLA1]|uniref:4Fe-4S dicluster domain-containing protein n=1 Tax=Candidatus Chlorobium masyuteum TaxID=2716876 RepID=UPI0014235206|nr:ferredoxin family protein [Candidatus Chlorobium masyuteum]NHQ59830.1 ferredoxin family protein [Candidatus Chlorobium masyuteum]
MNKPKKRRLLAPREEIAWFPVIDEAACNGCGDCETFCKPGVFAPGEKIGPKRPKMTVSSPYNCVVLCERCAPRCTSGAITLPPAGEFEQFVEYVEA